MQALVRRNLFFFPVKFYKRFAVAVTLIVYAFVGLFVFCREESVPVCHTDNLLKYCWGLVCFGAVTLIIASFYIAFANEMINDALSLLDATSSNRDLHRIRGYNLGLNLMGLLMLPFLNWFGVPFILYRLKSHFIVRKNICYFFSFFFSSLLLATCRHRRTLTNGINRNVCNVLRAS